MCDGPVGNILKAALFVAGAVSGVGFLLPGLALPSFVSAFTATAISSAISCSLESGGD